LPLLHFLLPPGYPMRWSPRYRPCSRNLTLRVNPYFPCHSVVRIPKGRPCPHGICPQGRMAAVHRTMGMVDIPSTPMGSLRTPIGAIRMTEGNFYWWDPPVESSG